MSVDSALEFQTRVSLSYSLGFDPSPAHYRDMRGMRDKMLSIMFEYRLIWVVAREIFPEEFEGVSEILRAEILRGWVRND